MVAFIVLDFQSQLGLKGDIARIGFFVVEEMVRSGIWKEMEMHVEKLVSEKHCNRIEVHCNERRKDAQRFYFRQSYSAPPKYLMKSIHQI